MKFVSNFYLEGEFIPNPLHLTPENIHAKSPKNGFVGWALLYERIYSNLVGKAMVRSRSVSVGERTGAVGTIAKVFGLETKPLRYPQF